jgi:glycosyltransferase involved in cell wall biosynthesis
LPKPIVSFIIAVYNGEECLADCIASINGQTFQDYEVIIVNDGSTDNTPELLSNWAHENDRVHIITRPNGGLTSALNIAIGESKGKYLARHDADDISSPFRIEAQVRFLEQYTETVVVGSWTVEFITLNKPIVVYTPLCNHYFISCALRQGVNPLIHGSIVFRKDAFSKLSEGYRFKYCQDYDLYLRLLSFGKFHIIEEILYASRRHSSSVTLNSWNIRNHIHNLIMYINNVALPDMTYNKFRSINKHLPSWELMEDHLSRSLPSITSSQIKSQYYLSQMAEYFELNKRVNALSCSLKSIKAYPLWWKSLLSLPFCIAGLANPSYFIRQYRRLTNNILSDYRKPCFASNINDVLDRDFDSMELPCKR